LAIADAHVLIRNSNRPDAGTLTIDGSAMAVWIAAGKTDALDHLTR
jgi:hypothetical protein